MKKLLLMIGLLSLLLSGCGFTVLNTNESNNDSMLTGLDNLTIENLTTDNLQEDLPKTADTSNFPTKIIKEGDKLEFKNDLAYDPDGDKLTYSFSKPLSADGVWETKMGDAGEYIITVTVSDGKLESKQKVKLIVEAINNLPKISNFRDISVNEGEKIVFNPTVTDEDDDPLTLTYSGYMTSSTYETTYDDAGKYTETLTVSDGKQTTSKTIEIVVNNVNREPTLSNIKDITVVEGETATIVVDAKDPDEDALSIAFEKPFDSNGVWETSIGDAGKYNVLVTVSDGDLSVSERVTVQVKALNNAPTLDIAKTITVKEGDLIELNPSIGDKDGDPLKVTYSGFMTSSTYQTTYADAGEYETTITVSDGKETVKETITIIIEDLNRAPVFNEELFN